MSTISFSINHLLYRAGMAILCCLFIVVLLSCSVNGEQEAAATLTAAYETEVSAAIEEYQLQWGSITRRKDPSVESGVATDPWLQYKSIEHRQTKPEDEPFWIITRSATAENVRVLEYDPERFKATACVVLEFDHTSPGGEVIQHSGIHRLCGVYVFFREDDRWKLAGFFNTTIPDNVRRDWDYAEDWLKDVIGDLPRRWPH